MTRIKSLPASPTIRAAAARPERYRPTARIQTVNPSKDDEDTLDAARDLIKSQWRLGGLIGLELNYDGKGKTDFRLVTDAAHESQTLTQFVSYYQQAKLSATQEPNLAIEDGEYVAATEFSFSDDYWHPLLGVADEDFGDIRDPLGPIVSAMSEGGRSDVRYLFQVLAHPVPDHQWSRRWSLPHVVGGGLRDALRHFSLAGGYLGGSFGYGFKALIGPNRGSAIGNYVSYLRQATSHTVQGVIQPLKRLGGYSRHHLVDQFGESHDRKKEGEASEKAEAEALQETNSRIRQKARSHGFVVTLRLVAVGDDSADVEHGINGVAEQVRDTFSVSGENQGVVQGLSPAPARRSTGAKRIISAAMERADGVDFHGRITQRHAFRQLRTKRTLPMIVTPTALASLIHMPQHPDVSDSSINWTSGTKGAVVPPDSPRFESQEQ
jgi:hypothetical protein